METKLIIRSFSDFGLNTYEAKSYLSLLERDRMTAVEVAKVSGVPRGRVYEILESLLAKGLCRSIPGKVNYYSAADPTVLKEKIAARLEAVEREVDKKKHELDSLKKNSDDIIESLIPLFNKGRNNQSPLEFIEIIKDPYQMHKKFNELVADSREEILIFTKPPYSVPKEGLEEQSRQQNIACRKGIKLRSIHEIPDSIDEVRWKYEHMLRTTGINDETRVIEKLPMKLAIFDVKVVLLPLEDPMSSETLFTTQVIRHPALAKSLKITFETLWEQAADYHALEGLLKEG